MSRISINRSALFYTMKSEVITPMNANDMILEKLLKKLQTKPKNDLHLVLKKVIPDVIKSKKPLTGDMAMKLATKKVLKK